MKRLLCLGLAAVLFLSLTACAPSPADGGYGRAVEDEIKEAFSREYPEYAVDMLSVECYGVFGDSYGFFLDCPEWLYTDAIVNISAGGVEFKFPSSRTLRVYCDGTFYGLKESFDQGILTREELETLRQNYEERRIYTIAEELSEARMTEMEKAWVSEYGTAFPLAKDGYLGTYRRYSVFFVPGNDAAVTGKEIAGYRFLYGNSFSLLGYRNGSFTDLEKLYGAGKVTKDDVAEIFSYYTQMQRRRRVPNVISRVLSADLAREIEAQWEETETGPLILGGTSNYYGIYQGYAVFEKVRDPAVSEDLTVDGSLLIRAVNDLFGYKDGQITPLKALYEAGAVPLVFMKDIADIHRGFHPGYYDGNLSLNVPLPGEEGIRAVELAWYRKHRERLFLSECYYGKYKGCTLFIRGNPSSSVSDIMLRGQDFRFPGDYQIYIYYNRKFLTLREFHAEKKLPDSFFRELYVLHRERFSVLYSDEKPPEPKPLSRWRLAALQAVWQENFRTGETFGKELVYYGTYRGNTVICRSTDGYTEWKTYGAGGVEFRSYGFDYEIAVYHDGIFYTLSDAFRLGYLTRDEVETIGSYHNYRMLERARAAGITS